MDSLCYQSSIGGEIKVYCKNIDDIANIKYRKKRVELVFFLYQKLHTS